MYDGDSFFTLPAAGRAGLLALSLALALLSALFARGLFRLTDRFGAGAPGRTALRLLAALAVFWAFVWLSPQVYYLYYQAIIDGLPWQVVVRAPPSPQRLAEILAFAARADLSDHARGLLGWVLILLAILPSIRRRPV